MLLDLCIDALPVHPTATHPKTGELLRALGVRRNGDPIWPVLGAAPDDPDDDDREEDGDEDESDDDDEGDDSEDEDDDKSKSKKSNEPDTNSVDYWKRRSRQNERDAKKHKRENERLKRSTSKPDTKSKDKKKPGDDDDQPDPEQLREQAREEARAEVMKDRVSDKIEAKARKFADPEDAAVMLLRSADVDDFLDDDGKIDVEAINEALDELLEKKPYLAAGDGKRFKGGGDGGARQSKKARPKSIGEAVGNRYKK